MNLKISNNQITYIRKANLYLISLTLLTFIIGLYFSMRIMYIHVPSAWLSLFSYTILAASCVAWFVYRNPVFNLIAKSIAPIGAALTLIALVTGSIWGKPTWGVWWVWDARLTSMLILFFLYLAYILLWQSISNQETASKISAALGIIGFINIPIIKFSVDWWNTLHQPASISKLSSPSIDINMLIPLLIMTLGYMLFLITLFLIKLRTEIIDQKILRLSIK